jgi:uncharacterized membrane protein
MEDSFENVPVSGATENAPEVEVRMRVWTTPPVARFFGFFLMLVGLENILLLLLPSSQGLQPLPLLAVMTIAISAGLWCLGYNRLTIAKSEDRIELARTIFGMKVLRRTRRISDISAILIETEGGLGPGDIAALSVVGGMVLAGVSGALHTKARASRARRNQLWQTIRAKTNNGSFVLICPIRQNKAVLVAEEIATASGLPAPRPAKP